MPRSEPLDRFLQAAQSFVEASLDAEPEREEARAAAAQIFAALETPANNSAPGPQSQPAVQHLDAALTEATSSNHGLSEIADAFRAIAPDLHWTRRPPGEHDAPEFREGHANALLVGPLGLERRRDVVVGVSLLAPHVPYPDHRHRPEELYIVMSEGEWYRESLGWYRPGPGAIVYHEPDIVHAMRAGPAPLFAVWLLWDAG